MAKKIKSIKNYLLQLSETALKNKTYLAKNIPFLIFNQEEKDEEEIEFHSNNRDDEILLEKRKRNQAYFMLDYVLSMYSYFDFFSKDAIETTTNAKILSFLLKQKKVTTEIFLMSFFNPNSEFALFLNQNSFTEEIVYNNIEKIGHFQLSKIKKTNNRQKLFDIILNKLKNLKQVFSIKKKKKKTFLHQPFSYELNLVFEKSAENALLRFKTPAIGQEILMITLMEMKNFNAGKIINCSFPDATNWYLFRYKLLKRLYKQEILIRTTVIKNQQFFAYLLKIHLSNLEFQKIIDKDFLPESVNLFRNQLFFHLLKMDFLDELFKDTWLSIKSNSKRKYLYQKEDIRKKAEAKV
jgi:hypothetical protein